MPEPSPARADVSVVVWVCEDSRPGPMLTGVLAALDAAEHGRTARALAAGLGPADAPVPSGGPATSRLRGERLRGEVVLVADLSAEAATGLLGDCVDPRVRVIRAQGASRGRARNLGVAAATGRYLLFTDDDVRVPEHWVTALVAPLRAGHADLVAGSVRLAAPAAVAGARPGSRRGAVPGVAAGWLGLVPEPPEVGRAIAGASLGASREVLESVGFDEALGRGRYPGGDDRAFRRDVVAAGFREHAVAGAPVERRPDPAALTPRGMAAGARAHGRSTAYLDRYLRGLRPAPVPEALRFAGRALEAALRSLLPGGPHEPALRARADAAYHRELLRLRHVTHRVRPRGPARGLPLTAGAPAGPVDVHAAGRRVAAVRPLVSRADVDPTVLPPLPELDGAVVSRAAVSRAVVGRAGGPAVRSGAGPAEEPPERGAISQFWAPGRLRRVSAFPLEGRGPLRRTAGE